jgi:GH15 family glucan-1,4-alpha-glucosidase
MTATLSPQTLIDHGVRVITEGQAPSGAYIASPNFPQYHFAWLRDGAYCALAMDAVGERASAGAFHDWVARVVETQGARIRSVVGRMHDGIAPHVEELLPTRYMLDGEEEHVEGEAWPNFQLDGYGTWLFALRSHYGSELPVRLLPAAELAADYLEATWRLPCYDYWEEYGDRQHTSTLAAIAAGLRAASRMLGRASLDGVADEIVAFILDTCVTDGVLGKGPDDSRVDASLLSLAVPFALLDAGHPVMLATVERLRSELASPTGGIRRYRGDTYFGGNPWLLLTAWLGWHDRLVGDELGHAAARNWVLDHATKGGDLPEQILHEPQDAAFVGPWLERWGPVANPLLWSHAKFILMESDARAATWD